MFAMVYRCIVWLYNLINMIAGTLVHVMCLVLLGPILLLWRVKYHRSLRTAGTELPLDDVVDKYGMQPHTVVFLEPILPGSELWFTDAPLAKLYASEHSFVAQRDGVFYVDREFWEWFTRLRDSKEITSHLARVPENSPLNDGSRVAELLSEEYPCAERTLIMWVHPASFPPD